MNYCKKNMEYNVRILYTKHVFGYPQKSTQLMNEVKILHRYIVSNM